MANKENHFNHEDRTFETRLLFINEIFSSVYKPEEIMASCIKYKLSVSYDNYLKELTTSVWNLNGKDPMEILKKIDRMTR